ncbi:retropepsin-like aspartic protease family protein [Maricaulis parjimensis]|uniref:retropepsin-like aspartic protease family protein n=1 Tax=Maricaulis parjimensis TaxID=144023 RepID=UPI00193AD21E|nr:TIGR02281 family clan AA aspartic protease [Maricaulis parjimensis]
MMRRIAAQSAFALVFFGIGFLVLRLLAWPFEGAVGAPTRLLMASMAGLLLAIAFLATAIAGRELARRNLAAWVSVGAAFIAIAFIDRDYDAWTIDRMWGDAGPESAFLMDAAADGSIILSRSPDGHYYIDARVNGGLVTFLVDTGASMVALDLVDAQAAGIRTQSLEFDLPVQTAAGQAMAAPVIIPTLVLAGHRFENVPGVVIQGGGRSLLGMSILNQFDGLEIRDDRLILRR